MKNDANSLIDTVPAQLGELDALKVLDLCDNAPTSIPAALGRLSSLVALRLGNNELTAFPAEIGQLTRLTSLDLGGNCLSGESAARAWAAYLAAALTTVS